MSCRSATANSWLNNDGVLSKVAGGWQVNTFFSYASGTLVTVTSNANVLNAPGTTTQFADKVKDGPVEIFGDVGPNAQYFDVSAYRPVTAGPVRQFGPGRVEGTDRTERRHEPVPRVPHRPEQDASGARGSVQRLEHAAFQQPGGEHLERHVQTGRHRSRR